MGTLVGSLEGAQVVAELEILGFAEIVGFLEAVELKVLFAVGLFEIILGHTAVLQGKMAIIVDAIERGIPLSVIKTTNASDIEEPAVPY